MAGGGWELHTIVPTGTIVSRFAGARAQSANHVPQPESLREWDLLLVEQMRQKGRESNKMARQLENPG